MTTSKKEVNINEAAAVLAEAVKEALSSILTNVDEDLKGPARRIAENLLRAHRANRPDLVKESLQQANMLLLDKEMHVRHEMSNVASKVLDTALGLLSAGIGSVFSYLAANSKN